MVVLETNWDGMLDTTYNNLSVTSSDNTLDATPLDGVLGDPSCTGVHVCVADDSFLAHKLLRNKFIPTRKT